MLWMLIAGAKTKVTLNKILDVVDRAVNIMDLCASI